MRYILFVVSIIILSGCNSNDSSPSPALPSSYTHGIWIGQINSTRVVTVIAENQKAFVADDLNNIWIGAASCSNQNITFTTKYYSTTANGTAATLTATTNGSQLTLITPTGTDALTYNAIYERNSSLSLTTGLWSIRTTSFGSWTITIAADGSFNGQFSNGCMANGQLSIINPNYNAYTLGMSLSGTSCSGTYNGLAFLTDKAGGTNNSLTFVSGSFSDGLYFDDIRKN